MSKTEHALDEAKLDDASDDTSDRSLEHPPQNGASPVGASADGELPAPTVSGLAPPDPIMPDGDVTEPDGEETATVDDAGADDAGADAIDVAAADPDLDPAVARSVQDLFDDEPALTPDDLPAPDTQGGQWWRDPSALGGLAAVAGDIDDSPPLDDSHPVDDPPSVEVEHDDGSTVADENPPSDPTDGVVDAKVDQAGPERPAGIPGEALKVSPPGADVLEELRTARVDGPTVEVAPQDDDSGYNVRRPQRLRDYDPAPIPIPAKVPRLLGRKPRVRKVTRVVRHVDPWSVFKIAIVANVVLYIIMLTAGVLLWNVANATGTVDNVERFFESFGWSSFEFNGGEIYHSAWIAGLFLVIGLTGAAVLLATLFNLITDLVGGMRFTVLEEEVVETRTSPMRRFIVRRPEPEVPAVDRDDSGAIVREAVVDDSGAIVRRTR